MRGTVECIDQVHFYIDLVNQRLGLHLDIPTISFSLRGSVSGRASGRQNRLYFNPILLDENPEKFVRQTVGHEVAHLASFRKFGSRIDPHGIEWARIMRAVDLPPYRCHNYDTSTVSGARSKMLCREVLE
jgi:SprT protein